MLAIVAGTWIAQGTWMATAVLGSAFVLAALAYLAPQATHVFVLAFLVCGYVVGNRGFAQLAPSAGLPLFPAECGLLVSGALLVVQSCIRRELPMVQDGLNRLLLLWIALGCARIGFDLYRFGFAALRDFALVYYAAFFFVAQAGIRHLESPSRWLHRILLATTAPLPLLLFAFSNYPDVFVRQLTFRGNPLIFYKGDLIGTLLSIGSVAWFIRFEEGRRRWLSLAMSLALAGTMLTTDNRASFLALVVAAVWLAIGGRWRYLQVLTASGVAVVIAILLWSQFVGRRLEDTPLRGAYEQLVSLTDFQGTRTYSTSSSGPKGDNNRFRMVWWQTVISDTARTNPYVGMGFGYDLAEEFLRAYYPDGGDDFSARSPHNVWVTLFARMGAIGVVAFLLVAAAVWRRTFWAVRQHEEPQQALPWCAAWSLLTAACFGVVLEGPMGAVVFWIALGTGNAAFWKRTQALAAASTATPDESAAPFPPEKPVLGH
ncbi:hypothetical protein DB347_02345 [Opitutaceae bacterium EW11]|nr:hypothetical protein DB347_02345 [Opitutaceae bacterium EW11]